MPMIITQARQRMSQLSTVAANEPAGSVDSASNLNCPARSDGRHESSQQSQPSKAALQRVHALR